MKRPLDGKGRCRPRAIFSTSNPRILPSKENQGFFCWNHISKVVKDHCYYTRKVQTSTGFLPTIVYPPFGACLEASKMIARLLRRRGIDAKIVHGNFKGAEDWPHWWVRVGDLLIDVTADQFTEEETESIVIGKASELTYWVTYKDRAFA